MGFQSLDAAAVNATVFAITRAMANVWILTLVAGIVLMVTSVFMRWERLF